MIGIDSSLVLIRYLPSNKIALWEDNELFLSFLKERFRSSFVLLRSTVLLGFLPCPLSPQRFSLHYGQTLQIRLLIRNTLLGLYSTQLLSLFPLASPLSFHRRTDGQKSALSHQHSTQT